MKNDCTSPEPLEYLCKFCRRPGVAYYDADCPPLRLAAWQTMLACDPCADYQNQFNRLKERIGNACYAFTVLLRSDDERIRTEAERATRTKLADLTHAFARLVCSHHRVTTVWQQEFVDMLIEKPESVRVALHDYARRVKVVAQEAAALLEA